MQARLTHQCSVWVTCLKTLACYILTRLNNVVLSALTVSTILNNAVEPELGMAMLNSRGGGGGGKNTFLSGTIDSK